MKRRTAMLRDSLPAICRAVTRQKGIRLVYHGPPRTDGRTIYSNPMPIDASEEQVKIIVGDIDHECGHILYTDFELRRKEIEQVEEERRPFLMALTNAIEDTMVERRLCQEYLGCQVTLAESVELLMEERGPEAIVDTTPGKLLSNYIDAWGRVNVLNQGVEPCLDLAREALIEQLGRSAVQRLDALLSTHLHLVASTEDSCRLARRVEEFLEEIDDEEEGDEQKEGQNGAGAPDGSGQSDGAPQGGTSPDSGNGGGRPSANDAQDQGPSPAQIRAAAQEMLSDTEADPAPFFDRRESAEQAREDAAREHYVPGDPDAGLEPEDAGSPGGHLGGTGGSLTIDPVALEAYEDLRASVSGEIRQLTRRIVQEYQTCTRRRWRIAEEGRIDSRRLAQAVLGNRAVYRQQERRVLPYPAVGLVVDASYSMAGDPLWLALQATVVLAETNAALDVKTGIHVFAGDVVRQIKAFEQPLNAVHQTIAGIRASGGTPMQDALWKAGCAIARRREERKLLFLITDGAPNDPEATKEIARMLDASGIEVHGIGIGTPAVRAYCRRSSVVRDPREIAPAILSAMREQLMRVA